MVWLSFILVIAGLSFAVACVAAICMQFNGYSSRLLGFSMSLGIALGTISLGTYLALDQTSADEEATTPDEEEVPLIVSLLTGK